MRRTADGNGPAAKGMGLLTRMQGVGGEEAGPLPAGARGPVATRCIRVDVSEYHFELLSAAAESTRAAGKRRTKSELVEYALSTAFGQDYGDVARGVLEARKAGGR